MSVVIVLGILAVVVSLWDKFGTPRYRPYRALVFIVFGLSGIAPATHYAVQNGWERSITEASLGWLVEDLRIKQSTIQKSIDRNRKLISKNDTYINNFKNAVYQVVQYTDDH